MHIEPTLAAAFRADGGLVTRTTALASGLTPEAITRLVRTGEWTVVRRGVYAERGRIEAATTRAARQRLRDDAACLLVGVPHVRSHESAALVLGLPVLVPRDGWTHVTRPGVRGSRHRHGVKHHLAPYRPEQVVAVDGIRVLDAARTAVDIARGSGLLPGVVAMDSARRAGTPVARLVAAFAQMRCWPGSTVVRQAIDLSDPGSDSVGESLSRTLVTALGRGRPQTQFGLSHQGRTAFVDLRIGRHLVEFDGRVKYQRRELGGLADKPAEEVVWEEKTRQDWLCGFKLGMSRLTWVDVLGPGRDVALARLEREVADTEARFGTSITDLARYVVHRRPARRPDPQV